MGTPFTSIYNCFLGKITDDMYLELTPQDTIRDLRNLLFEAIPNFEFPRKILTDYEIKTEEKDALSILPNDFVVDQSDENVIIVDASTFKEELTSEEINILAILMLCGWTQRQITSIENTRMKYSSSDFKMTSQANHLAKLLNLLSEVQRQSHYLQRLYKRRRISNDGKYESNWSVLRNTSAIDY